MSSRKQVEIHTINIVSQSYFTALDGVNHSWQQQERNTRLYGIPPELGRIFFCVILTDDGRASVGSYVADENYDMSEERARNMAKNDAISKIAEGLSEFVVRELEDKPIGPLA